MRQPDFMKRIHVIGLIAMSFLVFRLLASPTAPVDETGRVTADQDWAKAFSDGLEKFKDTTGVELQFEFHAKAPSAEEDAGPGVYMRTLSAKLGLAERGVVAVYFADEDEWRLWLGNELAPAFAGRAGTAAELTESGAMHDAKEAFLEKTWSDAAALQASAPAGADARIMKVRLQAESLVANLQARLASKK